MTGRGTPAWMSSEACVWRKSWTRGRGIIPSVAWSHDLRNAAVDKGLPLVCVNTKSSGWRWLMWGLRALTSVAGRVMVRTPFFVFGVPR